ncbi:hypothetical protein D1159_10015 [Pseudoflavonifractor sp. 524-17]|uniref:hypothetical protein n=1 Tax=Pseudoflavonifractor sp. 524-17 TaxID=2304577 RepID=UPI00137B3847|nr:hypothetical protein [Pseudoflavonifractor sp. 524-17]NCE64913.1 hypothetical protein [Pseudoflavonifractor sp. 524-17]
MNKREKAERSKQEDAILNRVLVWIAGSVVLEALLLFLSRYYVNYTVAQIPLRLALDKVFQVLAIALPLCFAASLAWWLKSRKDGKPTLLPQIVTTVLAVLAACAVILRLYPSTGIRVLYTAVPCMAVLALIYYLYQREFFLVALMGVAGFLGLWLLERRIAHGAVVYSYLVAEGLLLAAVALLTRTLQTNGGTISVKGKPMALLSKHASYTMLYINCLVVALIQVVGLIVGAMMFLYVALIVWLLVMAVYYTARLM